MNYENFESINNDIQIENFEGELNDIDNDTFKPNFFKKIGKSVKKVQVAILGKKNTEKLNKGLSNLVKKSTAAIIGKKNQQKLARTQNKILGIKKKKKPSPPKPIVYALGSNNFNNDMYYDIFCPYQNYRNFDNSTFNKIDSFPTTKENTLMDCKTKCNINPACTSYTYNRSNKDCMTFKGYPSSINTNQRPYESGIKTDLKYSYKNLNNTQKKNVQKHCINKRFQNFYGDNRLDVRNCFNGIKNNKSNNYIDMNAQCAWNQVNQIGKGVLINKSERVNNNKIGNVISSKSMDKYQNNFVNYLKNIQGYFETEKELSRFDDKFYSYNTNTNARISKLKDLFRSTAEGSIARNKLPEMANLQFIGSDQINSSSREGFENKENFENRKINMTQVLSILILLILIIFIIYIKFY